MKKSDITKIFEGATEEQVNQILNLHNSEISSANTERDQYKTDLDAANEKLTGFDGVDVNALNQQIQDLQNQLASEKAASAVRFGLMEAKALDTDYLTFKLNESLKADNKTLELTENGKIKDWDNLLQGLQTKFPAQFGGSSGTKKVEEHKLPDGDKDATPEPATLADALHDFYESEN